jgi:hypothetical protein
MGVDNQLDDVINTIQFLKRGFDKRIDGPIPIYSSELFFFIYGAALADRLVLNSADNHVYANKQVIYVVDRPSGEVHDGWTHRVCESEDVLSIVEYDWLIPQPVLPAIQYLYRDGDNP